MRGPFGSKAVFHMNWPFFRAMAWSALIHFAALFLFSISNLFVPRSTGAWTAIEWRPFASTIEILPRLPESPEEKSMKPGVEVTKAWSNLPAQSRRRSLRPIQTEEPSLGENRIASTAKSPLIGDLPESLGIRRQRVDPGTLRGAIRSLDPVIPAPIPLPDGLVVEWRNSRKGGSPGVSAASLGVEGPSSLTARTVFSHPWPEASEVHFPHEPVVVRFAVTSEGYVKRVIPETLGDAAWGQTVSECLMWWRFAPTTSPTDGETWGRIRF